MLHRLYLYLKIVYIYAIFYKIIKVHNNNKYFETI